MTSRQRSKVQLAGAHRLKDHPLWNREFQTKILDKFHKGISISELKKLQYGHDGKYRSRLQAENKKVIEVMTKRGPGSLKKHPPVGIDVRLTGREPIVPKMESMLDVNMFISDTGNIHTDKEAKEIEQRFADSVQTRVQKMSELHRLHRLIHSQMSGTSTNTILSRFRAHFQRATVFYLLSSTTDTHGQTIPCKRSASSGGCLTPEDYLKEALHDICVAIHIREDIAPAFYNRALVLRKLHCHEAACGDVVHALKLLNEDVGNNELAMIKYRRLAALLEREIGLFIESAMEYGKAKDIYNVHVQHAKAKLVLEKKKRLAKRMQDANQRFKIEMKRKQKEDNQKSMQSRIRRLSTRIKLSPLMGDSKDDDGDGDGDGDGNGDGDGDGDGNGDGDGDGGRGSGAAASPGGKSEKKSQSGASFLSIVHQLTGGKHMNAVLKAKAKFLHGLLTPIAKAMAGTIPGQRTVPQIDRIVNFLYSTNSDDLMSLEPRALKQVCQWLGHESVAAGKYVFKKGAPQNGFYVLASGMAQVMVVHPKLGYEIPVKTLHPGDSFGKIHFPTEKELEIEKQLEQVAAAAALESSSLSSSSPSSSSSSSPSSSSSASSFSSSSSAVVTHNSRIQGPGGRTLVRKSSILARAWASDSMDDSSKTRRASIYANRHCELLVLKWSHEEEQQKANNNNNNTSKFDDAKQQRKKAAIRSFQDHTIRRRFNILKKCNVFKHLRERDLQRLATVGSIHQWHQGKVVMHQGEVLNQVFVIVHGVCEVRKRRKMSEVQAEAKQRCSPTGQGENPLAVGMMWQQQYKQHMDHRKKNLINAKREAAAAEGNGLKGALPTQWVKVGMVKGGDICGEMVLLNPTKSTVSPIEIIADTSVDALVFSIGELKPFINHGMFSGRTRTELVNSVGMHVPSELKVTLDLAAKRKWNKQKSVIVKSHVVGNRHLHPVGWIDPETSSKS